VPESSLSAPPEGEGSPAPSLEEGSSLTANTEAGQGSENSSLEAGKNTTNEITGLATGTKPASKSNWVYVGVIVLILACLIFAFYMLRKNKNKKGHFKPKSFREE
jgi:hypothetical protein